MVLLVLSPSLLLTGTSADTVQTVALVAILAAVFTFAEYRAIYPSLVEFRDAPPFNRLRFGALAVTVLALAVIAKGKSDPSLLTDLVSVIGAQLAHAIDFPYSPVRLVVLMLPENASDELILDVRMAAGLSYLVSVVSLAIFVLAIRFGGWPNRSGEAFNVWVNMPTFDPTAGGDVVHRLERDSQINLVLGFLLPFLIPAFVKLASDLLDPISLENPHTLIWTMTAWAFLPASLIMRGIAMSRIARMISNQRERAYLQNKEDKPLPA